MVDGGGSKEKAAPAEESGGGDHGGGHGGGGQVRWSLMVIAKSLRSLDNFLKINLMSILSS